MKMMALILMFIVGWGSIPASAQDSIGSESLIKEEIEKIQKEIKEKEEAIVAYEKDIAEFSGLMHKNDEGYYRREHESLKKRLEILKKLKKYYQGKLKPEVEKEDFLKEPF